MSSDCPGESSLEKECYWKHSLMFQQPDSDDNFGPMPLSPGQLDYITCTITCGVTPVPTLSFLYTHFLSFFPAIDTAFLSHLSFFTGLSD